MPDYFAGQEEGLNDRWTFAKLYPQKRLLSPRRGSWTCNLLMNGEFEPCTLAHHRSLGSSMVGASHWSSEGCEFWSPSGAQKSFFWGWSLTIVHLLELGLGVRIRVSSSPKPKPNSNPNLILSSILPQILTLILLLRYTLYQWPLVWVRWLATHWNIGNVRNIIGIRKQSKHGDQYESKVHLSICVFV